MRILQKLLLRKYASIGPSDAQRGIDAGAILLDVREPQEWRAGHAPSPRHIPLNDLARRQNELSVGVPIITVCRSGARSTRAATLLADNGRTVLNLSGGMLAWSAAALSVIANGGRPGSVT